MKTERKKRRRGDVWGKDYNTGSRREGKELVNQDNNNNKKERQTDRQTSYERKKKKRVKRSKIK